MGARRVCVGQDARALTPNATATMASVSANGRTNQRSPELRINRNPDYPKSRNIYFRGRLRSS